MCSDGQRFSSRGSVEELNSDMVVRPSGAATGGPRAIQRASILLRRTKRLLRQRRGRIASLFSSVRKVPGRANAIGSRSNLCLHPAKPKFGALEAKFSRRLNARSGRPNSWWRKLNILLSSSLANYSMGKALRRCSNLSDVWIEILELRCCFTSVKFSDGKTVAGIGCACLSFGTLNCGWDYFHDLKQDRL
jgi:hypothetical protein